MKKNKWLKPGLGIKRWFFLGILGIIIFSFSISPLFFEIKHMMDNLNIYVPSFLIGLIFIFISFKKILLSFIEVVNQCKYEVNIKDCSVNEMLYKRKFLDKGPKIVVIGGGTGLSVLLRGLKQFTSNITAIVTVADDGGGSGILREDLGMLPPGDIRSCILALANTEPTMEKLIQYRFKEGKLKGQNFGNLFIAAMNGIYGNFERAIKEMSNVLAVKGKVLPMTLEDVKLYAKLENGLVVEGESNIPVENKKVESKIDYVFIKPKNVYPVQEAIEAIKEADAIILGPGSLYTSVIPNLLVKNIVRLIQESNAIKVYIANVMTQPGETDGYSVLEHVEAILKHSKKNIIDYVISNVGKIPDEVLEKYYKDGAKPVTISAEDEKVLNKKNIVVIKDNLVDVKKNYIRHNAIKLSQIIIELVNKRGVKKEKMKLFQYLAYKGGLRK